MARIRLVVLSLCLLGCATTSDSVSVGDGQQVSDSPQVTSGEPTTAQVDAAVAQHNAAVTDEKDKVICTREVVLGTHFRRRVCRTVRAIEEDRRQTREELERRSDPAL